MWYLVIIATLVVSTGLATIVSHLLPDQVVTVFAVAFGVLAVVGILAVLKAGATKSPYDRTSKHHVLAVFGLFGAATAILLAGLFVGPPVSGLALLVTPVAFAAASLCVVAHAAGRWPGARRD